MNVSILGTGYVGLVTGLTLAKLGHPTICVDIMEDKIRSINQGNMPFYEKGMEGLYKEVSGKGLFKATTDIHSSVLDSDVTFVCVGTPSDANGEINLDYIQSAVIQIGQAMKEKDYHLVVIKSTVVPGTTEELVVPELGHSSGKWAGDQFGVCMNPEFLREGSAVYDSFHPDRIIIGELEPKAGKMLEELYTGLKCPVLHMDLKTAEMVKYASNALLATKISFANEVANLCTIMDIDVDKVMEGVGLDSRINPAFLSSGIGFGGSCFPKDVSALLHMEEGKGLKPYLLASVLAVNDQQPKEALKLLKTQVKDLQGKTIAVLGLAFKPDTDDIRESRAIPLIKELVSEGVKVRACDPMAIMNFKSVFPDIEYFTDPKETLEGADACILHTAWKNILALEPDDFLTMKRSIIIDGRRMLASKRQEFLEKGIIYLAIGLPIGES